MARWRRTASISHPVNALFLTYASYTLAKRSNAYWTDAAAVASVRRSIEAVPAGA